MTRSRRDAGPAFAQQPPYLIARESCNYRYTGMIDTTIPQLCDLGSLVYALNLYYVADLFGRDSKSNR